jgi:N-acetylmuramoyl-L-alanine amidase
MQVMQNFVPASKYKIKCPNAMVPEFLVVHNTANDASAANEIAYMIRNDNQTSFHYAIDDKEIIQGITENRNAWHAGDGNGPGNRKGLSIEICYSKSGGPKFIAAEKLAAKFVAFKLKEKGWDISKVKKHQDFSGKYCPHRTLDMGWQRFLEMVKREMKQVEKAKVIVAGQECDAIIYEGKTYVEVRKPFELAGFKVNYNAKTKMTEIVK